MPNLDNPLLYLSSAITLGLLLFLLRRRFSAEARERRRRERSHRPVISRKHGPTVKLAVKVDKPRRERQD